MLQTPEKFNLKEKSFNKKKFFCKFFPPIENICIEDIDYIISNQRSEQLWASKEHSEWMEGIFYNYCHFF